MVHTTLSEVIQIAQSEILKVLRAQVKRQGALEILKVLRAQVKRQRALEILQVLRAQVKGQGALEILTRKPYGFMQSSFWSCHGSMSWFIENHHD